MKATITSIKLKSWFSFFPLSMYAMQVIRQMNSSGHLDFKKTGIGKLHYTMSLWKNEEDMRNFARSGAHLQAMRNSSKIATEIRTITIDTDQLPGWSDAKSLLMSPDVKVIVFK